MRPVPRVACWWRRARDDQPRRLVEWQDAGAPGGGHLADRMAERQGRADPLGGERADDGDLHGEQQRLRHVGARQHRRRHAPLQQRERRPAEQRRQRGIGLPHRGAEGGAGAQRLARHGFMLGAIAGEDEGEAAAHGLALLAGAALAIHPGGDGRGDRIAIIAAQHEAMRREVAMPRDAARKRRRLLRVGAGQRVAPALRPAGRARLPSAPRAPAAACHARARRAAAPGRVRGRAAPSHWCRRSRRN